MAWHTPVHSVRKAEVDLVRKKLSSLSGESYVVVRGPKGVGKTCILDSVFERRPGFLRLDIYPGTTGPEILMKALSALSGHEKEKGQEARVRNVLKWHNRFYSGYPFVIILQAKERFPPSPYAEIGPAARDLGALGFKVLVDASQHALADKKTERERYVEVGFMDRDSLFKIEEFKDFYKKLETCDLKEELWEIIGGSPMKVRNLVDECNDKDDVKEIIVQFLLTSLEDSLKSLNDDILRTPELSGVFSQFQRHDSIFFRTIKVQSSEIKSLRMMGRFFVPSNPTVGFILRVGLADIDKMLNEVGSSTQEKFDFLKKMMFHIN
jgi:hypothetical protein